MRHFYKNILCSCFFFIILIKVYAEHEKIKYDDLGNCILSCNEFNIANPQYFDYIHGDYSTIDWYYADQTKVPPDRIKEIPANKVDVTKVQDTSKLTSDQLSHKNPSGEININKIEDWNKLNQKSRDETLSQLTGKNVFTENENIPLNGEITNYGFVLDSIKILKVNDNFLKGGIKVVYDKNKDILNAKQADFFYKKDSLITNINNLQSEKDKFIVGKAESFVNKDITINNIENSELIIDNEKILLNTDINSNFRVEGIGVFVIDYSSNSNKSKIIMSKNKSSIIISSANVNFSSSYKSENYIDSIETNHTAEIEIDQFKSGIKCIILTPTSRYSYNAQDTKTNFAINIPQNTTNFKLCIERIDGLINEDFDGLIDFTEKKIILKKPSDYLRYPLKNNRIFSYNMEDIIKNIDNFTILVGLDDKLIFIEKIFINGTMNNSTEDKTITMPNNYFVVKESLINNQIHRLAKINIDIKHEIIYDSYIHYYDTYYFNPVIEISNNVLFQKNGTNSITILNEKDGIKKLLNN